MEKKELKKLLETDYSTLEQHGGHFDIPKIKDEITNEIQYKMLQKMKKDRENSIKIYLDAYEKTGSNIAKDN